VNLQVRAQGQIDPAAIVQSQENQTAGLAAAWLGSDDARTRAWGAYLALRDQRRELLPQLTGLVKTYPPRGGSQNSIRSDNRIAMMSVLDAVIQMDGRISPEDAARLHPEFPVQSIILLSLGDSSADGFLLDIFRNFTFIGNGRWKNTWQAAGNLLMSRKPSDGFAAVVFDGLAVHLSVFVQSPGSVVTPFKVVHGLAPLVCMGDLLSHRAGWPPVGNYYTDRRGVLIASGADPSFYIRSVGDADPGDLRPGIGELPCDPFGDDWDTKRENILADLVGEQPGKSSVRASVGTTIIFQNDSQYLRDLQVFVRQQQGLLEQLRGKLTAQGLLSTAESAAAQPFLELSIFDNRSTKPSMLPILQNAGRNVTMMNTK
jgi:hypothetical protein